MTNFQIYLLSALVTVSLGACRSNAGDELSHHHHDHAHAHNHAHPHAHEEAEEEHQPGEIVLEPEVAERFGVETETVKAAPMAEVIKVFGTINSAQSSSAVVTSPTSGIVTPAKGIELGATVSKGAVIATVSSANISGGDPNEALKAAYDAARREFERLEPLYRERLVTAADYNAARLAYEQAAAAYKASAASGRITAPISGVITSLDVKQGEFVNVGQAVAAISSSAELTLTAYLPEKHFRSLANVNDATFTLPYSDSTFQISDLHGRRIASDVAASRPGYIPVCFTFANDGSILPGANVTAYLLGAPTAPVISVPVSALSEQQGAFFVFTRLDEDCYRKNKVETGRSDGRRIEIKSGLAEGDNVVVSGTTTVRLAESSGVVPEGHSHNH